MILRPSAIAAVSAYDSPGCPLGEVRQQHIQPDICANLFAVKTTERCKIAGELGRPAIAGRSGAYSAHGQTRPDIQLAQWIEQNSTTLRARLTADGHRSMYINDSLAPEDLSLIHI